MASIEGFNRVKYQDQMGYNHKTDQFEENHKWVYADTENLMFKVNNVGIRIIIYEEEGSSSINIPWEEFDKMQVHVREDLD